MVLLLAFFFVLVQLLVHLLLAPISCVPSRFVHSPCSDLRTVYALNAKGLGILPLPMRISDVAAGMVVGKI